MAATRERADSTTASSKLSSFAKRRSTSAAGSDKGRSSSFSFAGDGMGDSESLKKRTVKTSISKFGRTQNLGEVAPPPLELLELGHSADEEKAAYKAFVEKYPDFPALDSLRASDYGQLDSRVDMETGLEKLPEIYLDYTGAMQTGKSHVYRATELVTGLPLGNPHSSSQTSSLATKWVQRAEQAVLAHMNTDSNEYYVIWTPNASGACRLVAEWFDFGPPGSGATCAICQDNHNSVHGIREEAVLKGAEVLYTPLNPDTLHMDSDRTARVLSGDFSAAGCRTGAKPPGAMGCLAGATGKRVGTGKKLFAYPLQSNVSGVKHSLDWIQYAHDRDWVVFADAAAFMPTNFLDLTKYKPDFVSMSFYKMFGHPTGVGALLVRHEAAQHLVRKKGWFAGGTIAFNSAMGFGANRHLAHEMAPGKDKFEEGTVNFSNFLGVFTGLEYMRKINETGRQFRKLVGVDVEEDAKTETSPGINPMNTGNDMLSVQRRVRQLTDYLLSELSQIKYPYSEQRLVMIYGRSMLDDHKRGGTIPLNVMTQTGQFVWHGLVEELANKYHISIRTGCFCNPGVHEAYSRVGVADYQAMFNMMPSKLRQVDSSHTQWEINKAVQAMGGDDIALGCIRVSVGFPTNFSDVFRFVTFMKTLVDQDWTTLMAQYEKRVETATQHGPIEAGEDPTEILSI